MEDKEGPGGEGEIAVSPEESLLGIFVVRDPPASEVYVIGIGVVNLDPFIIFIFPRDVVKYLVNFNRGDGDIGLGLIVGRKLGQGSSVAFRPALEGLPSLGPPRIGIVGDAYVLRSSAGIQVDGYRLTGKGERIDTPGGAGGLVGEAGITRVAAVGRRGPVVRNGDLDLTSRHILAPGSISEDKGSENTDLAVGISLAVESDLTGPVTGNAVVFVLTFWCSVIGEAPAGVCILGKFTGCPVSTISPGIDRAHPLHRVLGIIVVAGKPIAAIPVGPVYFPAVAVSQV